VTDITSRDEILRAAGTVGLLQLRHGSGTNLLAALCDLRADADVIASLVDREPGLAARVLRVANSAFYGHARNITTVGSALLVLGFDAVRGIAAAACMDRGLQRPGEGTAIDLGAIVRHSLGTAVAAEHLARLAQRDLAGEAFIAGLLHNLGLPIQARLDAAGLQRLVDLLARDPHAELRAAEAATTRVGHETCAAVLFESWNLPTLLVDAVRHHHAPTEARPENRTLALLVHLAAGLSARHVVRPPTEPLDAADEAADYARLGITAEQAEQIGKGLAARVAALAAA
jgi:HD-like signal output (HDOD) protein